MSDVTITTNRNKTVRSVCAACGRRFHAKRHSRLTCSPACRQARWRLLHATTPLLPEGPFDLIVADPPLSYRTWSPRGQGRSPGKHYQTLDMQALCRLPIEQLAAPNAGLAIWVYGPRLPETLKLIAAWGFTYDSDLFSWLKITRVGQPRIGTGYTTRKTNEQMIYAVRGNGLRVADHSVPQAVLAPRTEHSAKPNEVMLALEQLFGPVRRLELFARRHREGWTGWGNQLPDNGAIAAHGRGARTPLSHGRRQAG
jgi:N6-adenosine-specific RNA methylase IME4